MREMVCCVLCMEKSFSNWNENFLCAYVQFWNATLVFHFGYDIWNGVVIHTSLSFYPHIFSLNERISYLTLTNHHWYIGWCHHLLKPQSFRFIFLFSSHFCCSFLLAFSQIHWRRYHSNEHLLHETNKNSH